MRRRERGPSEGATVVRKVLVASSVHPASDTRIFYKEIQALCEAGYRVTLLARDDRLTDDGVRFLPAPEFGSRVLRILLAPWAVFWKGMRERADLYHIHDPELLWVGVACKVLTGARVVFDAHENVVAQLRTKHWVPRWLRRPLGGLYSLMERLVLPCLDAVVLAEDSYAPVYAWHRNVCVIHNYPLPGRRVSRERPSDRPRLVYVGGMTRPRGAMTMLQAAARLRDRGVEASWSLVGPASPNLEAEMRAYIAEHRLDRTVDLIGGLPFPAAQDAVAEADIGLAILDPLPNYVESMPTKLLEYLAAGLPVIASDFPLWRSLISEFECGVTVPPGDPAALAEAVGSMASDPDNRHTMGENGRTCLMARQMIWASEARILIDLYERLLAQ